VADEGPGVPEGAEVFERFATGDAAQGAGLGLAIAQELAERMDGSIGLVSAEGEGSTFAFELPLAET
jgi:signal transduction histidine kinase